MTILGKTSRYREKKTIFEICSVKRFQRVVKQLEWTFLRDFMIKSNFYWYFEFYGHPQGYNYGRGRGPRSVTPFIMAVKQGSNIRHAPIRDFHGVAIEYLVLPVTSRDLGI